jgi:alpha-tubulin suppressor-like RCC1 family protein
MATQSKFDSYKSKVIKSGLLALATLISSTVIFSGLSFADSSASGYQWGVPGDGTGSFPTNLDHHSPTAVTGIPNPVVQVVASNSNDYALDNTGAVWAWGAESEGELGNGQTPSGGYTATPTQVQFPAGVTISSLAQPMPFDTGIAIDTNGNVWGWGNNSFDQLCVSSSQINTPVELPFTDVTMASGAGDHALYYSNGTLYACGANGYGDLGSGSKKAYKSTTPVVVTGLPSESITSITTSWRNSGALMSDGSYYDWGYNSTGQLGRGSKVSNTSIPAAVLLPTSVSQVSLGGSNTENGQTIVLLSNGSVYMWGNDAYGQLGNGSTKVTAYTPTQVDVPSGVSFDFVNSGGASAYAIDTTGNAWSWGQNNKGQLGLGSTKTETLPTSMNIQLNNISATSYNVYGL